MHLIKFYKITFLLCLCFAEISFGREACSNIFGDVPSEKYGVSNFGYSTHQYIASRITKLINFDESAWLDLFDHFIKYGDAGGTLNYDILPLLLTMPQNLRDRLDIKMREAYHSANKDPTSYRGDRVLLAPKRALVTYLHRTSDAAGHFERMQHNGIGREQALDLYMNSIRERLPSCSQCMYQARQVFAVAAIIQRAANEALAQNTELGDYEFILFGSFPNGRANVETSDLDILSRTDDHKVMLGPKYQEIRSAIGEFIPGSNLNLSFPTAFISAQQASVMSPVQIRITPTSIEMHVYPDYAIIEWAFRTMSINAMNIIPNTY